MPSDKAIIHLNDAVFHGGRLLGRCEGNSAGGLAGNYITTAPIAEFHTGAAIFVVDSWATASQGTPPDDERTPLQKVQDCQFKRPKVCEPRREYHGWIEVTKPENFSPVYWAVYYEDGDRHSTRFAFASSAIEWWDQHCGKPVQLEETPLGAYRVYTYEKETGA